MFGDKETRNDYREEIISGLIEKGCEFEGKLTFEGTVRLNGKFQGEIFSEGTLIIGEGAEVNATIEVGSILIHGQVTGNIRATDRIEMHATAVVHGDIQSNTLVIDEGVIFEGTCSMGKPSSLRYVEAVDLGKLEDLDRLSNAASS